MGSELPKLTIEKFADAGIMCLRFAGTIDESFDGKRAARSVDGDTLVLDLGGVRKISSFGIREWVDFIGGACKSVKQALLIECAPKVVDQLNMVANFAGAGRVISFYAPFRCDYCDSEHRVLLDVARDFEAIRTTKLPDRPCPSCKEVMYFDEDGATYFSYVLGQGAVEVDANVVAFLAAKLDYRLGVLDDKFRVDKVIEDRMTYLRLAGELTQSFPRDKLADGLEGTVVADLGAVPRVDPAGAAEWRSFVQQASPIVDQLWLIGVAPPLLERICNHDDLGAKAMVIDLVLPYACTTCGTTTNHLIDVADHHAVLKFATAPELSCATCSSAMQCAAAETTMTVLPGLPKPAVSKHLQRTIAELRARVIDKKPTGGVLPQRPGEAPSTRASRTPVVVGAIAVVALAAGLVYYTRSGPREEQGPFGLGPATRQSTATAPSWVEHDLQPGDARCRDIAGGVMCVGVSSTSSSLEDAEDEANDITMESIAFTIEGRAARATHVALDTTARDTKLARLHRDPASALARREVREGQRAVAHALRGAPPPAARFWQAFATRDGDRFVAMAQITLSSADMRKLVERSSAESTVLGATVVTAPAEVGWHFPKADHGALVVALDHGALQELGIAEHDVVLAVDGRDVTDAAGFAQLVGDEYTAVVARGGTFRLLVQTRDGDPREFQTTMAAPRQPSTSPPQDIHHVVPTGGVNVWDRFGGSRGSERPPTR